MIAMISPRSTDANIKFDPTSITFQQKTTVLSASFRIFSLYPSKVNESLTFVVDPARLAWEVDARRAASGVQGVNTTRDPTQQR
jgi:hypothetical protein